MKLTVVICTHNRSVLLMRTIASLNEAFAPKDCSINLLVIANACIDETVICLKNYQSVQTNNHLPLIFYEELKPGKSYALNHALELVDDSDTFICFVDDDHRVDNNYFKSIINSIEEYSEAFILCGKIIPDWTGTEPEWIHDQGKYKIFPLPVPHFELGSQAIRISNKTRLPGGGNLVVKKAVFEKVGNFSVALGPKGHNLSGSEDSEFILRALSTNIVIQYVPIIIQFHYVDLERLKFSYLLLKSFQRTRSLTLAHTPTRSPVPLYIWRKLLNYAISILFSFNINKIRFYLMRFASTTGEMVGLIENRSLN